MRGSFGILMALLFLAGCSTPTPNQVDPDVYRPKARVSYPEPR